MGKIIRDVLTPRQLMDRLVEAQNEHQVDRMLELFHGGYDAHIYLRGDDAILERRGELSGMEDLRKYWTGMFEDCPNFAVEELGYFQMNDELATAGYYWDFGDSSSPVEVVFIIKFEECGSRLLIRSITLISWDPPPR